MVSGKGLGQETITEGSSFQSETPEAQDKKLNSTPGHGTQPKAGTLGPFHRGSVGREGHSCREERSSYRLSIRGPRQVGGCTRGESLSGAQGRRESLSSPEIAPEKIGFDVDPKETRKGHRVAGRDVGSFPLTSEGCKDWRARQEDQEMFNPRSPGDLSTVSAARSPGEPQQARRGWMGGDRQEE